MGNRGSRLAARRDTFGSRREWHPLGGANRMGERAGEELRDRRVALPATSEQPAEPAVAVTHQLKLAASHQTPFRVSFLRDT